MLGVIVSLINQKKLAYLPMEVVLLPVLVVLCNRHGSVLLQRVKNPHVRLNRLLMKLAVLVLIFHHKFLKLLEVVGSPLERALHKLGIINLVGKSPVYTLLLDVLHSHVFGALGAIKFDHRSAVPSTEARMVTVAESVELPLDLVEVVTKSSENNGELSLLLLEVDQGSEERRADVVLAFTKELHQVLLVLGQSLLVSLATTCLHFVILVDGLLFFPKRESVADLLLDLHREVELFFGSLRQ